MVVRGDASGATTAAAQLDASLDGLARAERAAAGGARETESATRAAANAQAQQATMTRAQMAAVASLAQEIGRVSNAQRQFTSEELAAAAAIGQLAIATGRAEAAQRGLRASAGQLRAGTQQLSAQIGDVSQQLALGVNPAVVFGQQFGQIVQALQLTQGTANRFVNFLSSTWGAVIIGAVTVLGLLVGQLFRSSEATEQLAGSQHQALSAADALSRAQSALGQMFDLGTGKLEHNTEALRLNTLAIAANIRAEAQRQLLTSQGILRASTTGVTNALNRIGLPSEVAGTPAARDALRRAGYGNFTTYETAAGVRDILLRAGVGGGRAQYGREEAINRLSDMEVNARGRGFSEGTLEIIARARNALNDQVQATSALRTVTEMVEAVSTGRLPSGLRRDSRGRTPRQDHSAERTAEFGRDAADRIASLRAGFEDAPPQIEKVRSSLRQLDDLLDDIGRRRPPNFQQLLEQGRAARAVIQDGIGKPYRDFLQTQSDSLAVARLQAQGLDEQAAALRIIQQLETQMGPLTEDRKDAILASVQALRLEQREMDVLHEKQQRQLTALAEVRSTIIDTIRGGVNSIADVPKRLLNAFKQYTAEFLFERFFGDAYRRIQDAIQGRSTAEDAAQRFSTAVDGAQRSTAQASTALDTLAGSASRAAAAISGPAPGTAFPARPDGAEAPAFWPAPGGSGGGGQLPTTGIFSPNWASEFTQAIVNAGAGAGAEGGQSILVQAGSRVPRDPAGMFSYVIQNLAHGVLGEGAAAMIGKVAGKGLEGAAIGGMVAGVGRLFGLKTSSTGGQIGGAIGSLAGLIPGVGPLVGPIASAVGGLLGGVIGGLFKKSKTGSATLSNAYDDATLGGNNAAYRKAAGGLATSIQSSILNIAEQLGGGLGSFSVSIGEKDGKFRVDPTGRGNVKTKRGAVDFGDDQAAAVAYAVLDAIRDGAVTGLSKAVQQALTSSDDIERNLREALKVQELETLIGGLGSSLAKQFSDFDRIAADRVRLAKKYGLDVLAIEKINAEQRAALLKQVLESRVGALLNFQKDMQYGDLYEGDAPTRRASILADIADVTKEAEAGIDGAADKLAELYRLLLGTSEDAFGTAGPEYAADRAKASEEIARVIQLENDRVAAAAAQQQAQTDALNQGNVLTGETNDLLAITNGLLTTLVGQSGGGGTSTGTGQTGGDTADLLNLVGRRTVVDRLSLD